MDKKEILTAIKQARDSSPKRKFVQNFDVIINLKNVDLKKESDKVNSFVTLPHPVSKKIIIAALVGPELSPKAKQACDVVVVSDEFKTIEKKRIKKLAGDVDYFIAQATIMPQIAGAFGKILGPRGKMPNVKAGCVVPPSADLKPLIEKLQKTVRVETKNEPTLKTRVGMESSSDEEIAANVESLYNTMLTILPQDKNNIKNVILKLTMGKPVVIGRQPQEAGKP